ncbi:hypothetical protein BC567DRAFT_223909 [Phyllosticta citribraziliensis]
MAKHCLTRHPNGQVFGSPACRLYPSRCCLNAANVALGLSCALNAPTHIGKTSYTYLVDIYAEVSSIANPRRLPSCLPPRSIESAGFPLQKIASLLSHAPVNSAPCVRCLFPLSTALSPSMPCYHPPTRPSTLRPCARLASHPAILPPSE